MIDRVRSLILGAFIGLTTRPIRRRLLTPVRRGGRNEIDLLYELSQALGVYGVMIDVGARYGVAACPFARAGWRVVAFEPDPHNQAVLRAVQRWLPRIEVDPRAVSDECREEAPLYISPGSSSLSSLIAFDTSHRRSGSAEVVTLEAALLEHEIDCVDVLKVDTEGNDLKVLQGLAWDGSYRPSLVMCEFDDRKVNAGGHTYGDITELLLEAGYSMFVSEWYPMQVYGAGHRWRAIEACPYRLQDGRSHGNVIGIDQRIGGWRAAEAVVEKWARAMARTRREGG